MSTEAGCPACGSPVAFDVPGSIVAVCDSCRTLVGRGDGALEDHGKVADLAETDSPLQLDVGGRWKGKPFRIVGRTQLGHAAGGSWDEWYLHFADGRWGWLAEAQGRLHLTFRTDWPQGDAVPELGELHPDQAISLPGVGTLRVAEVGRAAVQGAEGELPFRPDPGELIDYADLSGGGRRFATIDFSETPPGLFVGSEVTLGQLGLSEAEARAIETRRAAAVQVKCPDCGGTLDLVAPDQSLRVACPFCGSLHECRHGELEFLEKQAKAKARPQIPLGSSGTLSGIDFQVIGFVERSGTSDGESYTWQEYLLYSPRKPFHWLICSDGHWSLGTEVPAGEVERRGDTLVHGDTKLKLFDAYPATVEYVLGEFYWKVEVGERVRARDYSCPPFMLTREIGGEIQGSKKTLVRELKKRGVATQDDAGIWRLPEGKPLSRARKDDLTEALGLESGEVHYTLAEHVPHTEVAEAFGIDSLPRPQGIGAISPNPLKGFGWITIGIAVAFVLTNLALSILSPERLVHQEKFVFTPVAQTNEGGAYLRWAEPPPPAATRSSRLKSQPMPPIITLGGLEYALLKPGSGDRLGNTPRDWMWALRMAEGGRLDVARHIRKQVPGASHVATLSPLRQTLTGSNLQDLLPLDKSATRKDSVRTEVRLGDYQRPPAASLQADFISKPFELKPRQNIELAIEGNVNNSWVYISGDLRHLQTKTLTEFSLMLREVHGYLPTERVREGGRRTAGFLSALPAGTYAAHLHVERSALAVPFLRLTIRQGVVNHWGFGCCLWTLLSLGGGGLWVASLVLESARGA